MSTPSMSCPSGGTFYACLDNSKFVGCCASDPCGNNGCPEGNLYAASFDPAEYGQYSDQQCDAGQFWTCSNASPPFWGCCQDNPCNEGCPTGRLVGAFLSNNPSDAAPFQAMNGSEPIATTVTAAAPSTTAASTAGGTTLATTTSSPTSEASSTSRSDSSSSTSVPESVAPTSHSTNVGAIAGGAVGGVAVLAAFILGLIWLLRKRRNAATAKSDKHNSELQQPGEGPAMMQEMMTAKQDAAGHYAPNSPSMPSYPNSPQPPYSPAPPSYHKHMSYELPGSTAGQELESGQRFHPYRPGRSGQPVSPM